MKKFYSLLSVVLFGAGITFGQVTPSAPIHKSKAAPSNSNFTKRTSFSNPSAKHTNGQNHTAAIVWSDDFSVPGNWNITHAASTVSDWVIGTNGPSGPFAIPAITSTSAANGFAMFDSDLMCDTTNGQVGDLTNVTPINCTGHSAVRLNFEESYCRFFDSTYVMVSNDGINWTLFDAHPALVNNDYAGGGTASTGATINPNLVSINISSVAGNQATVYIRFEFYSPRALSPGNAGCGYAWMIDDVVIEDLPSDDIGMVDVFPSPYTIIPLSQAQPIDLAAMITNTGGSAETNAGFNANVYFSSDFGMSYSQVFSGPSGTVASFNPGDTTATLSAGPFTFTDTGVYAFQYVSFMTNADGDGSNDTITHFIVVDDTSYARDVEVLTGTCDNFYGAPANDSAAFGNMYDVYSNTILKSVTINHAFAQLGGIIRADIYDVAGGMPNAVIATSGDYAYSVDDTSSQFFFTLTLQLTTPLAVAPGQYFVSINQADFNNMGVGFNTDISTPGGSFAKIGTNAWDLNENIGLPGAWDVRANIALSDFVKETALGNSINVYPNPTNGMIYIHNSGQKDNMTVTVFNSLGQTVYTGSFSQLSTAVVDLTKESAGMYSVQVKSDKDIVTKSVMISNK